MRLNDEAPSNAAHWHKVATEAQAEIDRLRLLEKLDDWVKADAARFRMLLQQHKHWLGIFRCDPDGAPSDSLDHVELRALLDQLIAQERSA